MSKDIKVFLDYLSSQTGLPIDQVSRETEESLAGVVEKKYPEGTRISVQIDEDHGTLEIYRVWTIVQDGDNDLDPAINMTLTDALSLSPEAAVGEEIFESLPVENLGRIVAAQAKQHIYKIIRDGQNQKHRERFSDRVGEVINGKVKRVTRDYLLVELGENADGIIYKSHIIPREVYRVDDKIKAEIINAAPEYRNAVCELSRTSNGFIEREFHTEVPEISEGSIEIKAVARDPGSRAKIAVKSNDRRVDPIGACIGMRGTRVQAVSNELNGERIDVILWDDDLVKMVIHALSPGEVSKITMNEEEKSMDLLVEKDQLAQIIGRNGQNIRLASDLVGWKLNIIKSDSTDETTQSLSPLEVLCHELDIDAEIAEILISKGYTNCNMLSQASVEALAEIDEFDEDIAEALHSRAISSVLKATLTDDEQEQYTLTGFGEFLTAEHAKKLHDAEIKTQDDLAELAIDELQAIIDIQDDDASKLIMLARKPWFEDSDANDTNGDKH